MSWIDFLLHLENYKRCTCTTEKLTKDSLTIPSIVRQAQYDNMQAFLERVQKNDEFSQRWSKVERDHIERTRKKCSKLIDLNQPDERQFDLTA